MATEKLSSGNGRHDDRDGQRDAILAALGLSHTTVDRDFDVLANLAQRMLHCQFAMISFFDANRQWFKAQCGLTTSEVPLRHSICAKVLEADKPLLLADASIDPRFAANPFVAGPPFIRFYAGIPIRAKVRYGSGETIALGTLCVFDGRPRQIGANGLKVLEDLALLVEALIDARMSAAHAHRLAVERQAYIQRLDREQRQFKQAERMANIGSWRVALDDKTAEWSEQVFFIHGLPVSGTAPLDKALSFYPPHARTVISAAMAHTTQTGEPFDVETDFVPAQGGQRRVRSMGEVECVDGKPVALIGVFQDITARYQLEQALRHNARTDDLTELPNRAGCNTFIDEAISRATERNEPLALLLIDLDGFKTLNDRCGHLAGDDLLKLVGSRLRAPYLSRCFAARLGGDEFVLVVSAAEDCDNLPVIVQRLLADLRHTVTYPGGKVNLSGTIGISWLDHADPSRRELIHRADLALYTAKQHQRGTARTFAADDASEAKQQRRAG